MMHEKPCPYEGYTRANACSTCEAIRIAVAKERERCAKIAETHEWATDHGVQYGCLEVAAAIREQQP